MAVRDIPEKKVVIFAEVLEDAVDNVTHCAVHPHGRSSFALRAKVTSLPHRLFSHTRVSQGRYYSIEEYVPIRVDCELKFTFKEATASLIGAGQLLQGTSEVTHIDLVQHKGYIAACVGPHFSGELSRDWVQHHSDLGVESFYSFVPYGTDYMNGKYNTEGGLPHHVLEYLHGYGSFKPEPVLLSPQPAVEYLLFAPPASSFYFGQVAMMHACWYLQRYAYNFVLAVDTDEYLWVNSTIRRTQLSLRELLDEVPAFAATVVLHRYTYPKACQEDAMEPPSRARHRTAEPHWQGKLILRPLHVIEATVHSPIRVRRGMQPSVYDSSQDIFLKHVREGIGHIYGVPSCEGLIEDALEEPTRTQGPPSPAQTLRPS